MTVRLSIVDVVETHSRLRGGDVALRSGAVTVSYRELWDRVTRFRVVLSEAGVRSGEVVATSAAPTVDHLAALIATMAMGAVAAPMNTRLIGDEAADYAGRLRPAVVLTDGSYVADTPTLTFEDLADAAHRLAVTDLPERVVGVPEDAPAIAFPTGGTTGTPKAALWSHRGLRLALASSCENLRVNATAFETYISPFFHVTLVTGVLTTLSAGGQVSLHAAMDIDAVDELTSGRCTRIFATPTVFERLIAQSPGPHTEARCVLIFGASRSHTGFVDRLRAAFPNAQLITGYGSTEFGAVVRLFPEDCGPPHQRGVGRAVPGVDLLVVDQQSGAPVPRGALGEICVRSPWRMLCYLGASESPELSEAPEFLRSGDIGYLDDEGYLHLAGRIGDVIKTGGEKVFPAEVEAVLLEHPAVVDAAVVGMVDQLWGERVEAAVVLASGGDAVGLDMYCRARLASYKCPKHIHILGEMPYTANMKLDRRAVREALTDHA